MKKFISGLIAAFLLSAGFVAISAETASAACKPSQYVQCQTTKTNANGPKVIKRGKKPKTAVVVRAPGNQKPKGTLLVTYKGPGVSKTVKLKYNGKATAVVGPALKKKGTYTVIVVFKGVTPFKDSTKIYKIRVR